MRRIMILIGIILFCFNLYSQNRIDPQILNENFNDTTIFDHDFTQKNFLKGWNWEPPGKQLDEALSMNFNQHFYNSGDFDYEIGNFDNYASNMRLIICLRDLCAGYGGNALFNSQALCLFPTLDVDTSQKFKPRPYDSSGAIFGFFKKNKVRILDSSQHANEDYPFVMLDKDSIGSSPVVVLDSIWKGDALHFFCL